MQNPVQLINAIASFRTSLSQSPWRLGFLRIALALALVGALAISARANPRSAANAQHSKRPFDVLAPDSTYMIDDGTSDFPLGVLGGGDLIALNEFPVIPGSETIDSVSISWGPARNGLPYTVAIWSDPNGDGNPTDAVLLITASGVVRHAGTNTFITTLIAPTTITTPNFFVGFLIPNLRSREFAAAFDTANPLFNRSYYADAASGTGNIENLNDNDTPVAPIESFGAPFFGNWLIRADTASGGLTLTSAASVKKQGNAGTFNIDLPLSGTSGVECRQGALGTATKIVFTFSGAVNSVDNTSTSCGRVISATANGSTVTVLLKDIQTSCDGSEVTVTLTGVNGDSGTLASAAVTFGQLAGDVNGNRTVGGNDLHLVRMNSGRGLVTEANFRNDVSDDGKVNHADISLTRAARGSSLP